MSRPFQASDRRVRLLQALAQGGEGLTLLAAVSAIGEEGRAANRATVVMLRCLRGEDLVGYTPAPAGLELARGGTYCITPEGLSWLEEHGLSPEDEPECEVTTGAMHGDHRQVLQTTAVAGQVPPGTFVASVFDLARQVAGA